jgi:hypothetical protein
MDDLPQNTETWVELHNPDQVVVRGREAWHRLREGHSWDDWLLVGEALKYGRHLAMLEAHTNEPSGARYQAVFGEWLQTTGLHEIDKATRSRLFDCLAHRTEIEAWRQTLTLNKRLKFNHPDSVWRNWQRSTVAGKATLTKRLSPIAKYKEEVARLENENYILRRAGDDLFTAKDTAIDIAQLLAERLVRLTPSKAKEILAQLPTLYAQRAAEMLHAKARLRTRPLGGT